LISRIIAPEASSKKAARIRFDVCCCFFGRLLSASRIASIIAMKGPSLGFAGAFDRR
jgi:hypothetical protein